MSFFSEKNPGAYRKSAKGYSYYLPASLPNIANDIVLTPTICKQMQDAALALGEFSSLIQRIPSPELFIHAYTRKEATLSSRIEGTQTNIEDAFKQEAEIAIEKRDDWSEVIAYIKAMEQAVNQLNELPLCNRLIKETHRILLSQVRGQDKQPGEFRRSQNWIGGSRLSNAHFVPPSHEVVEELMSDLEKFIQEQGQEFPELISAALIHFQFETIHPFSDGNGRLGRMLISLYLLERKILTHPILYISTFLESNRQNYYAALDKARGSQDGVLKWISFFLDAVEYTAKDGIEVTQKIIESEKRLKENISEKLGKRAKKGHQLLEHLYHHPVINAKTIQEKLDLSPSASQSLLAVFVDLQILNEVTGNKRNRVFLFNEYLRILNGEV